MQFSFKTAQEIRFGAGTRKLIGKETAARCKKVALIAGGKSLKQSGELDKAISLLQEAGVDIELFDGIANEPDCETIDRCVQRAKASGCQGVVAIGGGSVMDVGKSIAGLLTNDGGVRDYLDGVGNGKKLLNAALPFIAVPTTSGTGSETTNNAVLISLEEGWKRSIRDDKLLPALVICDPELILSLPKKKTAESGMDTLAQLIEAYTSKKATPISDMTALAGISSAAALPQAYAHGDDLDARSSMAFASMLSGIAITHGGVTACHGLASGFGGALGIAHGLACAILLPHVMEVNRDAMPQRYCDIAERLSGHRFCDIQEGAHVAVETVRNWLQDMQIPSDFSAYKVSDSDFERIMNGSSESSLSKNPVQIDWRRFVQDLI